MRLRVAGFHRQKRELSVFVPGTEESSAFPSLHLPSVVLNRVAELEEGRTSEEEDDYAEYFDIQVLNTAEFPLMIPHNLCVGVIEEVNEVKEVAENLSELDDVNALIASLTLGTELSALSGEEVFYSPQEDLQDFVMQDEDREPDKLPPSAVKLKEMVEELPLTGQQKGTFLRLLEKYRHVFAVNPNAPGAAEVEPHRVVLDNNGRSVFKHAYRVSPAKRAEIARQVKEKVADGLIQPSSSSFSAPVVLAPKKDGTWRFCVDYRELNKVTIPDKFPLPRIDDLLDQLGGNRFFSTMDLAAGFYQIPVAKEDRHKTAFSTPEGLFEWVRMPMGLTNSPATFQRAMNLMLAGLNWTTCLVYLDDIICFSKTFEEHLETLTQIFERLSASGFSLKLKKCHFFQKEVEYLGHVVSAEGRRPHPRNLKAVREFPRPITGEKNFVTHVQMFVGLCNYYAAYIPDYVQKVEPLTRLTKIGIGKVWGPEQEECFTQLQSDLCAAPLLRHPDFEKRFYVQTDACGYGLGAVLTQEFDDGFHPILYLSRSLKEAERKWAARELEALGVVWAVTKLRPYLEGRAFTVQTDHESLQWLMNTEAPGRLSRWAMKLQEFVPLMKIEYRRGEDNGNADALSRCPVSALAVEHWQASKQRFEVLCSLHTEYVALLFGMNAQLEWGPKLEPEDLTEVTVSALTSQQEPEDEEKEEESNEPGEQPEFDRDVFRRELMEEYQKDEKWRVLLLYLDDAQSPELNADTKREMEYRATHFFVKEGLLYLRSFFRRNSKDPRVALERLVVPDSMRTFFISQHHDSLTGLHFGSSRVSYLLRKRYYWPSMDREVRDYIKTCKQCQHAKATRQRTAGLLQPKRWGRPGMLSVDLQGPFPVSHGYDYILTMKDVFLGLVVLVPLSVGKGKGIDAHHCADAIFKHWVRYYGIPRLILTDRGPQFEAKLFERFCERIGVKRAKTAVYHPQTNSQAERQHGFHTPLIKAMCGDNPHSWFLLVPYLQYGINSSPMEGYGISPLEASSGVEPLLPMDLYTLPLTDASFAVDHHRYKLEHPKRMAKIHRLMNAVKKERDDKMVDRFNEHQRDVQYVLGDTVLAFKPAHVVGSRKLAINWRGPFTIVKVLGPNSYSIKLNGFDKTPWTVNVQNMVRFHVRRPAQQNTWEQVDSELPRPARVPPARPVRPQRGVKQPVSEEDEAEERQDVPLEEKKTEEDEETESIALRNALLAQVFIAPSPGRGRGVYCRVRRGFRTGQVLGEYSGRRISREVHQKECDAGKDARYALELDLVDIVIDAGDFRESKWPRYVNQAGPREKANVELVEAKGRAILRVCSPVELGQELLVDYGKVYDWKPGELQAGDPKRRIEIPPLSSRVRAFQQQVEDIAIKASDEVADDEPAEESKHDDRSELQETAPPSFTAIPDDVEIGLFVLIMHEPAPTELELGEVIMIDELREHATVHTYGTYAKDKSGGFAPCYIDPKDEKAVYTSRPVQRYLASTRQVFHEHIHSVAFSLVKKGKAWRLPKDVQDVTWTVKA